MQDLRNGRLGCCEGLGMAQILRLVALQKAWGEESAKWGTKRLEHVSTPGVFRLLMAGQSFTYS
jgi:hypothetical protein